MKSSDIENVVESEEIHMNMSLSSRQKQNGLQEKTFTIQVGAFLIKQNAEKCRVNFENKGYSPHLIILTDSQQKVWYTVRFGTYDKREEASQFAKEFSSKEKIKAIVRQNDAI